MSSTDSVSAPPVPPPVSPDPADTCTEVTSPPSFASALQLTVPSALIPRTNSPFAHESQTRDCTALVFTLTDTSPLVAPPSRPKPTDTPVTSPPLSLSASHTTLPSAAIERMLLPASQVPVTRA